MSLPAHVEFSATGTERTATGLSENRPRCRGSHPLVPFHPLCTSRNHHRTVGLRHQAGVFRRGLTGERCAGLERLVCEEMVEK